MDTSERHEKERQAWRRKRAQQIRAGFLRGRVFAVSLLCFGILWAIVFIQMATGNDPVLSAKAKPSAGKRTHRHRPAATKQAAVETVEESVSEPEAEAVEEPEAELEPLTTEQS
jgi:cytoskeletal protein RodZ